MAPGNLPGMYQWHAIDGRMVELCDECGFDARELAGGRDEARRLWAAYDHLARRAERPDADRPPGPGVWSAREYVEHCVQVGGAILSMACEAAGRPAPEAPGDLAGCADLAERLVPSFDDRERAALLRGAYRQDVTVEWLVRHLLHDTEHHVLDVRRNGAAFAMADHPEVPFRG